MCRRFWITSILLLFVALSVSASDSIRLRPCRVGTPPSHFLSRRAPLLTAGENPYVGNRRQLVVLASFQDKSFADDPETALQKWNKILNVEGYDTGNYVGSVHDYFMAQSYRQFNLSFDLRYVELPDGRTKYRSTDEDDENSQYLVDDIVDVLQTQDIEWEQYDWDGDSYVDQLLIIYAGEGMNASTDPNTIWPHQWWLSAHSNLETADKTDYRSYRIVTKGDQEYYIDSYCCVQEIVDYYGLKTPFGTICHEYSHCLGLPDFYYGSTAVVDEWDLMDYGCYGGHGFCPCNYSAHERMVMGWLTPVELTANTTISDMPALIDEPVAYLIRNDASANEYYIVENRQQRGWDARLPGSGILVFHVDYDKQMWEGVTAYVNSSTKKRYSIFPANNDSRVTAAKEWGYPYVVADDEGVKTVVNDCLTNTSAPAATLNHPNVDGRLLMSKSITDMALNDQQLASFTFTIDETSGLNDAIKVAPEPSPDTWLTIDGRRLKGQPTTRGLYLHNGRKVLVK